MTFPIDLDRLQVHFRDVRAVDDLTLSIAGGTICGLLGRNGAGKSTLLATLAAYRRPTGGTVLVDGEAPYENPRLMSEICLVRASGDFEQAMRVDETLEVAGTLRPRWDPAFAAELVDRFELPARTRIRDLSRGQRSALSVTVGLAARAPLTIFDEPHLGMDVPSRYAFYDTLLADYMAHPRTIVVSTHLIDEVASLFEDVVIIDRGRLVAHEPVEALAARGAELTGPADAVAAATEGLRVVSSRQLGRTRWVVVVDPVDDSRRARAVAAGVDIAPVPLQELFVHLTGRDEDQDQDPTAVSQEAAR